MTGFGEGTAISSAGRVRVRISGVNRRQLDLQIQMPRDFAPFEPAVRERIQPAFSRGRLQVNVDFYPGPRTLAASLINLEAAARAASALREMQRACGLIQELTVESILKVPGVLDADSAVPDDVERESILALVLEAADTAIAALRGMQKKEGHALVEDLLERIAQIETWLEQVSRDAPAVIVRQRDALCERMRIALGEPGLEPDRLVREAALLADRADITEEMTRARIHLQRFLEALRASDKPDAQGRVLDFLAQELAREFNTMSAKAGDAQLAEPIVLAKAEVERVREQIQNLE